jgi:hypothetical protein
MRPRPIDKRYFIVYSLSESQSKRYIQYALNTFYVDYRLEYYNFLLEGPSSTASCEALHASTAKR